MSTRAPAESNDLRSYLRALRRRKLYVIAGLVLGVAGALGYSLSKTPVYTATAQVLLRASSPVGAALAGSSAQYIYPSDVATQVQLVTSQDVRRAVASALGGPNAPPPVKAAEAGTTNLIDITASATSPRRAARIANAYAAAYIKVVTTQTTTALLNVEGVIQSKISSLSRAIANPTTAASVKAADTTALTGAQSELADLQLASTTGNGAPVLASQANPPGAASSPRPARDVAIGALAGLVFGLGLALLVDYFDDTLKQREDLVEVVPDLAVLGIIPAVAGWRDRERPTLVSVSDPASPPAEAYRTLRTSLQFASMERPITVMLVTSASESEGKTTTLANLAVAMAQAGQRVIVMCADLRKPRVHEFFGLSNASGFTSVLLGEVPLSAAIQDVPDLDGLSVIASGPLPPNPADLLSGARAAEVIRSLRAMADLVLIDAPPVLPVTDAAVLSDIVDATLVVATARATSARALLRALEVLGQVRAPIMGIVLNAVKGEAAYAGGYGYGYGYGRRRGYAYGAPAARTNGPRSNGTRSNGTRSNGTRSNRTRSNGARPSEPNGADRPRATRPTSGEAAVARETEPGAF